MSHDRHIEMERPVTGWRLWLRNRPTLFGYVFAGAMYAMVTVEVIKRSLPYAFVLGVVLAIGIWIGAS